MRIVMPFAIAAALFAGAAFGQVDGLVPVKARALDDVAVRPDVDLTAYRSVIVEPARASLRKDWLRDLNETRSPSRWLSKDDAQQIVDEAAARLSAMTVAVFRERGYAIAAAPAAGVLRLSPVVTELDVYAPDVPAPGIQRNYVRDAGQGTLTLEARDSVSGVLVARIADRGTAEEVYRVNRATTVSNAFWFDALFRQWATACAAVFAGTAVADRAAAAR